MADSSAEAPEGAPKGTFDRPWYGEIAAWNRAAAASARRVLDFGCGQGWSAHSVSGSGITVIGIDIDAKSVERGKRLYPGLDLRVGTLESFQFPCESFDCVITHQVLEHLADPDSTLAEVGRVLAPGGRLLVSVPNGWGMYCLLIDRLLPALRRKPSQHRQLLRLGKWLRLFQRHGFEVEEVQAQSVFPYTVLTLGPLGRIRPWTNSLFYANLALRKLVPRCLASSLLFKLRKPPE